LVVTKTPGTNNQKPITRNHDQQPETKNQKPSGSGIEPGRSPHVDI
jgi:hypothetical protein